MPVGSTAKQDSVSWKHQSLYVGLNGRGSIRYSDAVATIKNDTRGSPNHRSNRIAVLVPLMGVTTVACWDTWHRSGRSESSSSSLLLSVIEARQPEEGIVLANISRRTIADCDIDVDKLPRWTEGGNEGLWTYWGPTEALLVTSKMLDTGVAHMSGRPAVRFRYIDDNTSDFERRFLLGCMTATVAAPLCAAKVKAMIAAADGQRAPADQQRRALDQRRWMDKTLCVLAKGLAEAKPVGAPRAGAMQR